MFVDKKIILDFFRQMNDLGIEYVLLRNIDNELPDNFKCRKDIDLLVNPNSRIKFKEFMKQNSWKKVKHPWNFSNNFVFLYNMDEFEMYQKGCVNLDISYQLSTRSTNNNEWMPIDQLINDSVWINKKKNIEYDWYEMCIEDQLIHLLTRCVFDKKEFNSGYIIKINELIKVVNRQNLIKKLNLVFFKFTQNLLDLLEKQRYDVIRNQYIEFTDY